MKNIQYTISQLIKLVKVLIATALTTLVENLFHSVMDDGKKLNL